jgi:NAD(P)H-hydrate epimerase
MVPLDPKLYTAEQVRELDRRAITDHGIPGYELMQRAGQAAFVHLQRMLVGADRSQDQAGRRILVACGGGNNGGDGYVIATLAKTKGYPVDVVALVPPEKLQGDALRAAAAWRSLGGVTCSVKQIDLAGYDAIVDAILGTGLQRPVEGAFHELIELINATSCPVLAVDIPSGLNADTGRPMGVAVEADATVTFVGMKQGLFTGRAADYVGRLYYERLDVPDAVFNMQPPSAELITESEISKVLPPRPRSSHKGDFGHVLVIGGDMGMGGAACMAGLGALRVGAGLVTIATRRAHAATLVSGSPELMSHGVEAPEELESLLRKATVIAVGPGLGRTEWARGLLAKALDSRQPLVVDADGLNLLAEEPVARGNWVLTPHPGEAARLLNMDTSDVQYDRFAGVRALAARYGGTAVLKGAGTLVVSKGSPSVGVCALGNPGMASGGMGDILTGVIAGLLSQTGDLTAAARTGVWLHARAADKASEQGERGMLATDLLPLIRQFANPG